MEMGFSSATYEYEMSVLPTPYWVGERAWWQVGGLGNFRGGGDGNHGMRWMEMDGHTSMDGWMGMKRGAGRFAMGDG